MGTCRTLSPAAMAFSSVVMRSAARAARPAFAARRSFSACTPMLRPVYFSNSHEWANVEGDRATIGITHHAQDELGEVVYVDLPEVGDAFKADDVYGTVESVKAT